MGSTDADRLGQWSSLECQGMDETIDGLRGRLRLTDEEDQRLVLPGGLWHADSDSHRLCLVGRLLSSRVPRFEAFSTSIQGMINPVRGIEVRQIGCGRFLLWFNHIINRNRAIEGYPWSFKKNIVILNRIRENENPLRMDLDSCDFHVHVHELPLSMMNFGVATLLGNIIGQFRDLDMDGTGCAWRATLRLRVAINVSRPLPRTIPICSALGKELLVHLTYERLSNFCYLYGKLGHIAKYCELQFEDGFVDPSPEAPYGPWLQVPLPTRGRKLSQPKDTMGPPKSASVSGSGSQRGAAVFGGFSGLGPGTSVEHGDRTASRAGGIPTSATSFSPERIIRQGRPGVSEGYVQSIAVDSGSGSDGSMTAPAG
ncbi:hypothetical protein Salat_0684400 [Sesamum alatum]|uniref:DUF4283 domain-containing protein n=1 Tax=Sesamum alatum TaxID=300844 RepID=A0AAE1YSH7_9LAMI|nr:hypothetical protein Salat_0684400 [Sesamum alatum]